MLFRSEADYATLLNMLEETRAATGTSPDAPKSASLKLSNEGSLDVAVAADGGLVTGASGLSTDARVLWARNHAIATGASQYGMWDGGYAFIYILDGTGNKMLQFCVVKDGVSINSSDGFRLWDSMGTVLGVFQVDGTFEPIKGWVDRLEGQDNTWHFHSPWNTFAKLNFWYTPVYGMTSIALISV